MSYKNYRTRIPGDGLSILTDRDQRSLIFLNDPKKYFATGRRPKKILSKKQEPKNTLITHDLFSKS